MPEFDNEVTVELTEDILRIVLGDKTGAGNLLVEVLTKYEALAVLRHQYPKEFQLLLAALSLDGVLIERLAEAKGVTITELVDSMLLELST